MTQTIQAAAYALFIPGHKLENQNNVKGVKDVKRSEKKSVLWKRYGVKYVKEDGSP